MISPRPRISQEIHARFAFVWLIGLCCLLAACDPDNLTCADPLGCIEIKEDEPIPLAALAVLSGDAAYLGDEVVKGVEIALSDQGGDLFDHPLQLHVVDSGCQTDEGRAELEALLAEQPNLVGLIGPVCTAVAEATLPLVNQAGLVMISPANTAVSLTKPPSETGGLWQPGYYRTAPPNTRQAQIAADFAAQFLNARTAAIIYADNAQAQELTDAFLRAFRQSGGAVTFQGSIPAGATDLTDLLVGAMSSSPDVLYLPVMEPDGNLIVNAMSRLTGNNDSVLLGGTGLFVPTFPVSVGSSAVDGMYVVGPAVIGTGADALRAAWRDRLSAEPTGPFYGQAYDAANLLLAAIEQVAQSGRNGRLLIGRQALRDALTQTTAFSGVTGSLTCSPYGDCAAATAVGVYRLSIAQINGDTWPPELVWTTE